jgi:AP-4 complex subunit epsilon-1
VQILKKTIEGRLGSEYYYHRIPAPWIQIKVLKMLSLLGASNQSTSENMYEVLFEVMRRADNLGVTIGARSPAARPRRLAPEPSPGARVS